MRGTTLLASQRRNVPIRLQLLMNSLQRLTEDFTFIEQTVFHRMTVLSCCLEESYLFRFLALLVLYGSSSSFSNTISPVER